MPPHVEPKHLRRAAPELDAEHATNGMRHLNGSGGVANNEGSAPHVLSRGRQPGRTPGRLRAPKESSS